ncbi:MAG: component of SufBCD complex [Pseudomonadota bacterium]|uniref:Component of SufBCD complex n=1 Tax=Thalassococcus halodurans TaxID=373675 RepID=A0A1H5VR11_9RHOB|nr:component of SufBCD complex [Thalassococcus halodurans]MEC8581123.1 component of SufBCD complex [Pseudomonadota bacterium]SEF89456.1 hypothetical protein SAMN04488045_1138 [Thalassococcus halodurans]
MDWHQTVYELIDFRSFSNLWFWIGLAVLWSTASHWVIGVPFDMVARAARQGGQAEQDFESLVRINCNRILFITEEAGLIMAAIGSFLLSTLAVLAFVFDIELAQAIFLMAAPMTLVWGLSIRTARKITGNQLSDEPLRKAMTRHRLIVQAIGMVSIFVTALWGMFQNLSAGVFGG